MRFLNLSTLLACLLAGLVTCLPPALSSGESANQDTASDPRAAENQLDDMCETIRRIVRVAAELKGEANHQGINFQDEVDEQVLNPYPYFWAPGMNTTGKGPLLPPRKKWVDFSMSELSKLLDVLNGEVTDIASPSAMVASTSSEIKAQCDVLSDSYKLLRERYQNLQSVTEDPPYSNDAITRGCDFIKDGATGMNECRKRILRMFKQESKEASKHESQEESKEKSKND